MKNSFNILYSAFIGLLVLVGGFFLLPYTPFDLGIEAKIVQSGSMSPSIPVGALVFVAPSASYQIGDVVTFGEDSVSAIPTTHRILSVASENGTEVYKTKGDANEDADPFLVSKRDVIGKVYLSIPFVGFVLDFARQPLGFALLIGVPALLVVVSELAAIAHEFLGQRRKRLRPVTRRAKKPRLRPSTIEYVRRFETDDIYIPVLPRRVPVAHYASGFSSAVAVLCIVVLASIQGIGGTLSYFRDVEVSTGNTFSASSDFMLAGEQGQELVIASMPGEEMEVIEELLEEIEEIATQQEPEVATTTEDVVERGAREERGDVTNDRGDNSSTTPREVREGRAEAPESSAPEPDPTLESDPEPAQVPEQDQLEVPESEEQGMSEY